VVSSIMAEMTKPTWIIFDVGGVLLDWPSSSTEAAKHLGVTHDELFDVLFDQTVKVNIGTRMSLGEISAHEGWTMILKKLKKEHAPAEVISRWFAREFWLEDTLSLLTELHEHGYELAVMSNSWLGMNDPAQKHLLPDEFSLFDKIFDSSEVHIQKPDATFYEAVETDLGSNGEALFFIDDDQKNLDAAEQRGWQHFLYDMSDDQGVGTNKKLRALLLQAS